MVVVNCKNGTPPLNAGGKTAPLGRFVCRWSAQHRREYSQKAAADIEIMAARRDRNLFAINNWYTRALAQWFYSNYDKRTKCGAARKT
jgi:hypothetical protein